LFAVLQPLCRRSSCTNATPGQAVYDAFLGSGTTIIAAETTGRACFALEIDPTYVHAAVQRWQAFTGEAAVLEADGSLSGIDGRGSKDQRLK